MLQALATDTTPLRTAPDAIETFLNLLLRTINTEEVDKRVSASNQSQAPAYLSPPVGLELWETLTAITDSVSESKGAADDSKPTTTTTAATTTATATIDTTALEKAFNQFTLSSVVLADSCVHIAPPTPSVVMKQLKWELDLLRQHEETIMRDVAAQAMERFVLLAQGFGDDPPRQQLKLSEDPKEFNQQHITLPGVFVVEPPYLSAPQQVRPSSTLPIPSGEKPCVGGKVQSNLTSRPLRFIFSRFPPSVGPRQDG